MSERRSFIGEAVRIVLPLVILAGGLWAWSFYGV